MAKPKKRKVARKMKLKKTAKRRKVLVKKTKNLKREAKNNRRKKTTYQFARKGKFKKPVRKIKLKKVARKIKKIISRKTKKGVLHKVKKNTVDRHRINPVERFSAESLFKAKIKVIGIGGGGGSIVSEIGRSLEKATFVIADTDIRALKKRSGIKYFWFGEELTHGLGTGVNVDLAKEAAESAKEKISGFFKDQDIIIFVASLGGGLGSGATQVFSEAAREFGGITFGIFTLPFKFEGKNKQRIAQNALKSLRKSLNVSLVIPNEKIFKIIDESTPITNAFSTVNKSLIESLESLIDLIYNPGIINIDFADLRTILSGRGNSAFLNTIEESGKDKVEKVCENIFKNPLLQNSSFEAEKILFDIAGSENLSMFEVEKISSHIATLNPKAKIIFGISKDSKLKNRIRTTILMTGGQIDDDFVAQKPEEQKGTQKLVAKEIINEPTAKETAVAEKKKTKKSQNKKSLKGTPPKKTAKKAKQKKLRKININSNGQKGTPNPVSFIPVFEVPASSIPVLEQRRMDTVASESSKKTIRRSGLEIKKAEELQEKKRIAQEKEWEIPAFLRKIKFKS